MESYAQVDVIATKVIMLCNPIQLSEGDDGNYFSSTCNFESFRGYLVCVFK